MTEVEIVKIFKTYYDLLEREYDDRQLTILAAAQLTNAHILQSIKNAVEMPGVNNVNISNMPDSFAIYDLKSVLINIQNALERISQNANTKLF